MNACGPSMYSRWQASLPYWTMARFSPLVMEKVADEFAALTVDKARTIKFGDPMSLDTDLGAVVNQEAAIRFEKRVMDAAERGAKILYN
ncbi:MAG TPA: aldehyde dehydrogenase family protein, partial [Aestuariivirgaceae bacterium]|nr:aldehyde dehydrogenase family protein [Aestuariivirgaceae bacterium]